MPRSHYASMPRSHYASMPQCFAIERSIELRCDAIERSIELRNQSGIVHHASQS